MLNFALNSQKTALICMSSYKLCYAQPYSVLDKHHIQHQQPSRSYYLLCNCSLPFIYLQVHSQHFQKT